MNKAVVNQNASSRTVAAWLFVCCVLLLLMVGVGGYTRLTGSGLSITEWKPVTGAIPPLSEEAWVAEMEKYRASPEFQKINSHFTVEEFKDIYWVEYLHRLLGRTIGFAFLIPLLWFLWKRRLTLPEGAKLLGIFALGGLQGAVGWYMVKSGLVDNPHVNHLRLTLHLLIALLIYSLLLWAALGFYFRGRERTGNKSLHRLVGGFVALAVLQLMLGGFVAGLKAGFIYNTFPLMGEHLLPPDAWAMQPLWLNFLENPVMAQFLHRTNGILLLLVSLCLWRKAYNAELKVRRASLTLAVMVLVQVALGVGTLLMAVPVWLGVLHQVYAFLVVGKALYLLYLLTPSKKG